MNEYLVTLRDGAREWTQNLEAETLALARRAVEDMTDAEIVTIIFVRATSFSCRPRGGVPRR